MTKKVRVVLYLTLPTARALGAYQLRQRARFPNLSQAGEHLLGRAVLSEASALDEGMEGLLVPALARRVEEVAERVVREEVAALLRAQTDRLAGLLVRSGKDARTGATIGEAILERVTGDRALARRLADEARLAAGPTYTAPRLRAGGED